MAAKGCQLAFEAAGSWRPHSLNNYNGQVDTTGNTGDNFAPEEVWIGAGFAQGTTIGCVTGGPQGGTGPPTERGFTIDKLVGGSWSAMSGAYDDTDNCWRAPSMAPTLSLSLSFSV